MCEGSYRGDDLLDTVMRGISLSMCLPGKVTFDSSFPPHFFEAYPKPFFGKSI